MSEGNVSTSSARVACILLAAASLACRSGRDEASLAKPEQDRTAEFAILRERLDRLARRIETLQDEQMQRLAALELRANQLEARQLAVEDDSADTEAIRIELAQLKSDIVAIGAEEELDRMYRERLERLEQAFFVAEHAGDPGHSITDIWNAYLTQRDEIQRLSEQLGTHP